MLCVCICIHYIYIYIRSEKTTTTTYFVDVSTCASVYVCVLWMLALVVNAPLMPGRSITSGPVYATRFFFPSSSSSVNTSPYTPEMLWQTMFAQLQG